MLGLNAFRESWVAVIGLTLVFLWLFLAVTAPYLPLIDPNKPIAPFVTPMNEKRDFFFWLGTDFKGRDMLSRVIWGCQRVLVWGVTATTVAYIVGTMFGLIAGYLGGWWDEIISFVSNVFLSFPVMVLFIVILNYLGPSGFNIVIAVTFASAPAIMRIVRGLAMDIKTRDYVFAAQTRGEHPLWIMIVELLPNVRGPIIVDACLRLGYTTVAITTLTFLGLGLQPPDPDWGLMIREAAKTAMLWKFSYMLLVPALAVSSLILGFNLLADGLREISLRD
ncbi:MAG: ABC transporter permease [Rhodobiaceae bacterium]|nr:ABC transporter permease [Rhodobiaceae bacterium]MCC0053827.1 ABC transporter permease [Rhodobiaceae bacterium]